jgi:hypothetical protein
VAGDATDSSPLAVAGGAAPRPWLFQPGRSGNPGGRKKTLAALIRAQTGDGAELVAFMLHVLRGARVDGRKRAPLRLRMEAAAWLADRAFGKVPQPLEHAGADGHPLRFTLLLGDAGDVRDGPVDDRE